MTLAKEKLADMRWLLMKPSKFFEDVVRKGKYADCLVFMAALAVWIGIGSVVDDHTLTPELMALDALKVSVILSFGFVIVTSVWGLFAALI